MSPVVVRLEGGNLVGLPDPFTPKTCEAALFPPCPSCGRTVEIDVIEVSSLLDSEPSYLPGQWFCPSGCHPRYPRAVVAKDGADFDSFCREEGWGPHAVIFIHSDGTNIQYMEGIKLHPDMVHWTVEAIERWHHVVSAKIRSLYDLHAPTDTQLGDPYSIDLRPTCRLD